MSEQIGSQNIYKGFNYSAHWKSKSDQINRLGKIWLSPITLFQKDYIPIISATCSFMFLVNSVYTHNCQFIYIYIYIYSSGIS